jgi:hypothetical protein
MSIGEDLACRFEETNQTLIKAVEGASDEQWRATAPEGWPAGVTLHHVAESLAPLAEMVRGIALTGEGPSITQEQLNQGNAEHAARAANVTQAETARILRESGPGAAQMLRSLSDQQLANDAPMAMLNGQRMSAQQVAEAVLIGHGAGHLQGVLGAWGKS